MKLIAFDIGVHNFAFMKINTIGQNWNIININSHDFCKDKKMKEIKFDKDFWLMFHNFLNSNSSIFEDCDVILIEKQMGYGKNINYKAIQLGSQLFAHFILKFPSKNIIEYSAVNKTLMFDKKFTKKIDRKKWAVEYFQHLLKDDEITLEWLQTFKKKDDICDCGLMILSYLKKIKKIEFNTLLSDS